MGYVVPQLASHPSCPETRHFPSLVHNSHPPCVEDRPIPCRYRDLSRRQPPLSTLPAQSAPSPLRSLPRFPSCPFIRETISATIHQNLLRSFNASTALKCGHPHVWVFGSLLAERRCCHRCPQWDLTSPYQTTPAVEKRRSRHLHQRTKKVGTKCTGSSSSTLNSSPQSFTKLSGLDGHAITPSIIPLSQHTSVVWPVETCREIFAPSSSSSPRLFIGKSGEFINNSNSCERELARIHESHLLALTGLSASCGVILNSRRLLHLESKFNLKR